MPRSTALLPTAPLRVKRTGLPDGEEEDHASRHTARPGRT